MTDRAQKTRTSDIDRFEELPVEVVKHILSFLDMKEVLGTTVLARRWRELWRSLHTLKFSRPIFDQEDATTHYDFEGFVSHVLLSLDKIKLEKLILTLSYIHVEKFKKWMNIAFDHHVQEIHLHEVALPTTFHAHVKTLMLKNCAYVNDCFVVSCPQLECLKVHCNRFPAIPVGIIKILAPKLTALELKGYLFKGYSMENLSALVKAEIEVYFSDIYRHDLDIIRSSFGDIFIGVCTVKYLVATSHFLQRLPESPDGLERPLFMFQNLMHLKVTEWSERNIESLEKLMKNFPNLETLLLEKSKIVGLRVAHDSCVHEMNIFIGIWDERKFCYAV